MRYTFTLLVFIVPNALLGNAGSFASGNFSSGQLVLMEDKQISIENEDLTITLYRGYARVRVEYILKNRGDAVTAKLGFPSILFTNSKDSRTLKEIEDYSIYTQKKNFRGFSVKTKIPHRYIYNNEQLTWLKFPSYLKDEMIEGLEYPEVGWYHSNISFEKNEEIKVTISYLSNYMNSSFFVSDNSDSKDSEFRYLLSIGSTWKGPIKKGTIVIDPTNIQQEIVIMPNARFNKEQGLFVWKFKKLEPEGSDNILIKIRNSYSHKLMRGGQRSHMFYGFNGKYYIHAKPSTIKASSELKDYKVDNLFDHDFNTAWVEDKNDSGIGEYIECTFNSPQKLNRIGIIPGYNKTRKILSQNNRIAEVEVYIDGKLLKKEKIPDGYTSLRSYAFPAYYFIKLADNNITCKKLQLKITKVYKGSKYNDTCMSELMLLQQLENKPEVGGR